MPLTGRDIDQLVRTLAQEALAAGERERALAPPRSDAEIDEAVAARHERAEAWRTALARRDVDGVRPQVDAALAGAGIALAEDDPDRRILMREAAKAQVEVARIEAARERGHYDVAASGGDAAWSWRAAAPLTVSAPVAHAALGPAGVTAAGAAAPVFAMAATPEPTAHREAPTASAAPPAERPGDGTPSIGPAAPAAGAGAATDAAPAIRVGDAFDLLTEKLVAEGKTSMLRQVEGARTLACELLTEPGANPRLDALTPEIVELWRRTLLTVPRAHGKAHGNNGHTAHSRTPLTKRAEIERADAKDAELRAELDAACARRELTRPSAEARFAVERVARMAVVTVEKHLARLKQAIDLARKRRRFAGPNPCDEVEPLDRAQLERLEQERQHPGRVAWEPERLVAHLDGPVHTGCASEHRRGDRGDLVIRDSLYWVFLLCWLAGLRLREALQLRCADLVRVHGVWCVDVRAGPGQRLKNAQSRRRIPLHRFLLELGFVDWVQAKREEGPWLFDDMHGFDADDDMVRRFTRKFTNYRKRIGSYAVGRDAHALRTTFNTGLARAGVELVVRKRLMGHKLADLTEDDYLPGGRELRELKAAVDAATFGLALDVGAGVPRFTVRDDHAFADASEAETCAGDLAIAPDGSPLFLELVAAADTPGVPAEIRAAWLEDGAPRRLEATIRPHRSWGRPPAARRDPQARDAVELARELADVLHGRVVVGLGRDSGDLLARLMTLQTAGPRYRVLEPSVPLAPYTADPDHATRFAERVAKAARAGRVLGASELCGLWHQAGASGSETDRTPADEAPQSPLIST